MSRANQDISWNRIGADLRDKGTSFAEIALRHGVSPAAVGAVKRRPNHKIQATISAVLGKEPKDIWPTRYDRNGNPVRPSAWLRKNRTPAGLRHCQKRRAA